jgi:flavin-binding protein dodecin
MSNHTYRVIEMVGSTPDSVDAAIRNGRARATQTKCGLSPDLLPTVLAGHSI